MTKHTKTEAKLVARLKNERFKYLSLVEQEIKAGNWYNVSVIAGRLATICGILNRYDRTGVVDMGEMV